MAMSRAQRAAVATELARWCLSVTEYLATCRDGARYLKKSDGLLCKGERLRFAFIDAEKAVWPVEVQSEVTGNEATLLHDRPAENLGELQVAEHREGSFPDLCHLLLRHGHPAAYDTE